MAIHNKTDLPTYHPASKLSKTVKLVNLLDVLLFCTSLVTPKLMRKKKERSYVYTNALLRWSCANRLFLKTDTRRFLTKHTWKQTTHLSLSIVWSSRTLSVTRKTLSDERNTSSLIAGTLGITSGSMLYFPRRVDNLLLPPKYLCLQTASPVTWPVAFVAYLNAYFVSLKKSLEMTQVPIKRT